MDMYKKTFVPVPMCWVGPIKISGNIMEETITVPLATHETPLWYSVNRGAKISMLCQEGIRTTFIDERMSRSILLESSHAEVALATIKQIELHRDEMQIIVQSTSNFAKLIDFHYQIAANLLFIRFEFLTGDAAGHNMVTKAAEALMNWILVKWPDLRYCSISGNLCSDKKATAVNGLMGRGKNIITEIVISRDICKKYLRTSPEKIVELNIRKNLIGTVLAGGVRSANAHFANMLLAFYIATGQDAANIIEGSQGLTHTEIRDDSLYFSCTLPNIILGTIGNGKKSPAIEENLKALGCIEERELGVNSRRLAAICATTVLCGELSLIAAQTNPGELMKSHIHLERA
ncbi:Hydroxymethylglutaryl-CoA reductase [Liberibacter crescens BT-1]|uniref:Hydroxymethylglutaryl-CoA reductase n=1 Tax=Liberibacter crescens (strain BT-1) TaxID=1215343 RepID=L0ET53_LIBCB|nr:hydroxymethylglutaryl-CoA reductase [Liberibacter crescens]AGA64714.1 Hydroxymethylglutaryl-CoA reductase [Liberibacter crescens BT-1]AMC12803.1 hydroxymethylglutaryl-CoA reductase [Liberibacter crescens]